MGTKRRTVSVRLDDDAKQRIETAAKLIRQSLGAFPAKAGEDRSKQVLLEWALSRHRRGEASSSELTEQTGLSAEEIMGAEGDSGRDEGLEMFLARCRTVAKIRGNDEFLRMAREVVRESLGDDRRRCSPEMSAGGGVWAERRRAAHRVM